MYVELLRKPDTKKRQAWEALLGAAGLSSDENVEQTVLVWDDERLIATGSRCGNVLKCLAVAHDRQGEDLTSTVLSALRQEAFAEGFRHLFLYTKPQNESTFASLFFYPVAKTGDVLLMENRQNGIGDFLASLPTVTATGDIGAIVMNGNPFTKGHRYLIETAAAQCTHVYVFVVAEDASRFSFAERLEMARRGTADLHNVTVLSTGPYLVSAATFPTYFLKDCEQATAVHCSLDVEIFARYFVPYFGITRRYVGTEPLSPTTAAYNRTMCEHLPSRGVTVVEVPRLQEKGMPISASAVRQLLDEKQEVARLVPPTTVEFLGG